MQPVFFYQSFRHFLRDEFDGRVQRNDLYSLRAFARDLGLSHSRLSEFLNSKSPISARLGMRICEALSLPPDETKYLIDLIKSEFHRNLPARDAARVSVQLKQQMNVIGDEQASPDLLAQWYYIPMIEFLTLSQVPTKLQIAQAFDLDEIVVEDALNYLSSNGFISFDGFKWTKAQAFVKFESGKPSPHHKAFHAHFLKRAAQALFTQPIPERRFITWSFTVKKTEVEAARKELNEFVAGFVKRHTERDTTDAVYSLGLQFFKLGESHV